MRVSLRGLDNCSGHLPAVTWANIEQPSALANTSYRALLGAVPNEDENLIPAWAKDENNRQKVEKQAPDTFRSNEEPRRGLDPLRIDLIEDRFEGLKGKKLVKEEKTVQRFRHSPLKVAANQMLTGLGTGQGTWGTSSLQLTKLTTVQSREPKRRDVLVLPASMETFVLAIELLAEKHAPCEVAFIGTGERDTTFGAHTLASFPTHEPHKRKKIGWAWIKRENRPRRVAIAEICSEDKIAYALEIERTNQEHAILVLARNDFQRIGAGELQAFLLLCALRRGWVPEDQMPGYRRKTTTHRETSCYFGIGITHLEEDWGIVWKSHATGMSLTTGQSLFSRGLRYIVASIDNLFGKALGSATHRLGRRGGEERLKFANCPLRAC